MFLTGDLLWIAALIVIGSILVTVSSKSYRTVFLRAQMLLIKWISQLAGHKALKCAMWLVTISLLVLAIMFFVYGYSCSGGIRLAYSCLDGESPRGTYVLLFYAAGSILIISLISTLINIRKTWLKSSDSRYSQEKIAFRRNHNILGWNAVIGVTLAFTVAPAFSQIVEEPEPDSHSHGTMTFSGEISPRSQFVSEVAVPFRPSSEQVYLNFSLSPTTTGLSSDESNVTYIGSDREALTQVGTGFLVMGLVWILLLPWREQHSDS
ncbi:hypothetical protein [Glutamicibacter protophormiae]